MRLPKEYYEIMPILERKFEDSVDYRWAYYIEGDCDAYEIPHCEECAERKAAWLNEWMPQEFKFRSTHRGGHETECKCVSCGVWLEEENEGFFCVNRKIKKNWGPEYVDGLIYLSPRLKFFYKVFSAKAMDLKLLKSVFFGLLYLDREEHPMVKVSELGKMLLNELCVKILKYLKTGDWNGSNN